jgi:vanillate O-demethylase monooxygenase subunit
MAAAPFVRNAWYLGAWTHEVPHDGFLARTFLDNPWLIWRRSDGDWAMLADRCPHRFVPLSRGHRQGDTIVCGYHGLGFNSRGECVKNRYSDRIPAGAQVRSIPLVERHCGLWFWPGDPDRADPATIPDFSYLADNRSDHELGMVCMAANYELIADNLLDLTHAEFIHVDSFGTNGSMFSHGDFAVHARDDGGMLARWDITAAPPPAWMAPMIAAGETIDQWLHMRWHAPASMSLEIGIARTDSGRHDLIVPTMTNPHILTPETVATTHYFYSHGPGEEARAMTRQVFLEEDEPMVHAAQVAMGGADFWDLRPVIMPNDAAAIRARRILKQRRSSEARETADLVAV